jgi:hypothetical protein
VILGCSILCLITFSGVLTLGHFHANHWRADASPMIREPARRLPTLLLSDLEHDQASQLDASFPITNYSNERKDIRFVRASCGCIELRGADRLLKEGDSFTLLPGQFSTIRFKTSLPHKSGQHNFQVSLLASSPEHGDERIDLSLVVPVVDDVVFDPLALLLKVPSTVSEKVQETITVVYRFPTSRLADDVQIQIDGLPDYIKIVTVNSIEPEESLGPHLRTQSWQITLGFELSDWVRLPPFIQFRVKFTDARGNVLTVAEMPLVMRILSGIDAPRLVHMGAVPLGQQCHKRVLISAADGREFKLTGVICGNEEVRVSSEPSNPAKWHWINISYDVANEGEYKTEIVLQTSHPDRPRIAMDIIGRGLRPSVSQ